MRPARKRRLYLVLLLVVGVGSAVALVMTALDKNLMYFFDPTALAKGEAPANRAFKLGGLVKTGSVKRLQDGVTVKFTVTDTRHDADILYKGILPDLFREGQGIIADGRLNAEGVFVASNVLAKHDENYMPPEVAQSLEKAGTMPKHEMARDKN